MRLACVALYMKECKKRDHSLLAERLFVSMEIRIQFCVSKHYFFRLSMFALDA